jgi:hypothetical protein
MSYCDFGKDRDRLNGYAAECCLATAVNRSKKISPVNFSGSEIANTIRADAGGLKHLKLALPFLLDEFAESTIDNNGRMAFVLPDLAELPTVTVIDYVLGLDCCIDFFGYRIGIDITVNPSAIAKKLRKKSELKNVYTRLNFDRMVILLVNDSFDAHALESKLKVIKNSPVHESIHVVEI